MPLYSSHTILNFQQTPNLAMNIRLATPDDFESIWPIFHTIVSKGETYAFDCNTTKEKGFHIWMDTPLKTYVVEHDNEILGTYYLKANQAGPGNHVCNCGYMVSPLARGRGIATLMCEHSQQQAVELGFKAMQFNFVVSSNTAAVQLWQKLGFETVGQIPKAYNHSSLGFVDALVMYKWLVKN